jgi:hypothetical protein
VVDAVVDSGLMRIDLVPAEFIAASDAAPALCEDLR